ncbi:hypothetical protein CMUS01_06957 [Colletotrichum musicola]|uniref:Uncharacterized protein n=1 Tax=Colletotrichum musicola TaxID=2175873 RepID=A0A8H6KJY9_9PEZI|nr:hypothetical protein CMUS01_06957 [Colletotrichum musicola]
MLIKPSTLVESLRATAAKESGSGLSTAIAAFVAFPSATSPAILASRQKMKLPGSTGGLRKQPSNLGHIYAICLLVTMMLRHVTFVRPGTAPGRVLLLFLQWRSTHDFASTCPSKPNQLRCT